MTSHGVPTNLHNRRPHRLQSLVELATNKCIQNVARLEDVGSTPFHLLSPILERMNAKQLSAIEASSPHLTASTDTLWPNLIERDFPDRPIYSKQQKRATILAGLGGRTGGTAAHGRGGGDSPAAEQLAVSMPNKALYYKYEKERESFRNDSAKRLRNITERLKQEKEAKAIVSVPQLLRDPTVRRRPAHFSSSSGYSSGPSGPGGAWNSTYKKNTILNRARRDLQHRPLMFQVKHVTKHHDPYAVFQARSKTASAPPRSRQPAQPDGPPPPPRAGAARRRAPTSFNTQPYQQPVVVVQSNQSQQPPPPPPPPPGPSAVPPPLPLHTSTRPHAPSTHTETPTAAPGETSNGAPGPAADAPVSPIPPPRKRKPEPSIFLSRKRQPPRPALSPTSSATRTRTRSATRAANPLAPKSPPKSSERSKIQGIRSSIFS